jgi:hypothetical protein
MKASRIIAVSLLRQQGHAHLGRHGEPQHYSDDCTSEQKRESYEYARRHR